MVYLYPLYALIALAVVIQVYVEITHDKPEKLMKHLDQTLHEFKQTFFDALDKDERNWFIKQEECLQNDYGFHRLTQDQLAQLKKPGNGKRVIQNTAFYDMLAVQAYRSKFDYIPRYLANE